MPTPSDAYENYETCDDDDIELLEVRCKRRPRYDLETPNHFDTVPESQTQATPSRNHPFRESFDHFQLLTQNDANKETKATSESASEEYIMTNTVVDLTEELEAEGNIDRPCYDEWNHCEGFVAWWDNRTGKGMIINLRYSLEHKVELKDIKWSNYGALVPGSMVEYEYSDDGFSRGISKFWVVSGCEYVLFKDAWENEDIYLYMIGVKREHHEREVRCGRAR